MSKYVWCEDRGSGFTFFTMLFRVLDPEIIVESKQNNTRLRKAVENIADNDQNQYYIMLDNAVDNPDVLRESKKLSDLSKEKANVSIIHIHSFEFILLSFLDLENWIFAEQDDLKEKRQDLLRWKDVLVSALSNDTDPAVLNEIKAALHYSTRYNSEQLSAHLLTDITKNTGFETDKKHIGKCFAVDCCKWSGRRPDDICGLDEHRITASEKMRIIYERSVLKSALCEVGL